MAGKPHDRCRLGGNSYIISCKSHSLIQPPTFHTLPSQVDAFGAPAVAQTQPLHSPGEGREEHLHLWGIICPDQGTRPSKGMAVSRWDKMPEFLLCTNKGSRTGWESADLNSIASGKVELIGPACTHRSEAEQTKELEHLQLNQRDVPAGGLCSGAGRGPAYPRKVLMVGLINPAAMARLTQLSPSPDGLSLALRCLGGVNHPWHPAYIS